MKKNILLLSFIFLLSCGIEVPQGIPRLNTPNGVVIEHNGSRGIKVTWWGLNPENDFSGYNIYYTDNTNDAVGGRGTKIANKSGETGKPTLEIPRPFFMASRFSFRIDSSTYNTIIQDYSTVDIYIYVKAFSTFRNAESESSIPTLGEVP